MDTATRRLGHGRAASNPLERADDHHRPPFATDSGLRLERRTDGRLWVVGDGQSHPVHVRRCFPWSEPVRFLSLRDADDEEVAFVADPARLDADSRQALEDVLVDAGFVFDLLEVMEIEEEVELRDWRVRTAQGPRSFQTRLDDWPRALPGGGLLIRDVGGDLYRLLDPQALDRRSRTLLWAFVD
ncbi:MAG: DUF1854 domain-containing protein [Longimicrobiales bacterium]